MDLSAHLRERLDAGRLTQGKLLAAVSGGLDSVALLRGLEEGGFDVAVGHLDHSLRDESADDAAFVVDLAGRLGLDCVTERIDVAAIAREKGWNLEDAARKVRYEFLGRAAKSVGASAIVTAHTRDDHAETVLMQLLRGAAYLRGIAPSRGRVVRPLLDVSRSQLEAYLRWLDQPWREDVTNLDTERTRSWLRHELLPGIRSRVPSADTLLARHAALQHGLELFVREEARQLEQDGGFDRRRLVNAPLPVQREAIRSLFEAAGVAAQSDRIEELRSRLPSEEPFRVSIAPSTWIRLAYGRLEVTRSSAPLATREVSGPEDLPQGVTRDVLDLPDLQLRSRRPGDRIRLPGGSKKLSDVHIDRKVPREERDALLVLASGDQVLWAEGIGAAEGFVDAEAVAGPSRYDRWFMDRAVELARTAANEGELPVGAVVVKDGEVVGEGHNETDGRSDPTAHAEVLAMRQAGEQLGDWRLTGCTLYVTLEPCPMCAGAALESHLDRIVYGADNSRDGALGSVADLLRAPWKRRVRVEGGLLASEASELLRSFFGERRRRIDDEAR